MPFPINLDTLEQFFDRKLDAESASGDIGCLQQRQPVRQIAITDGQCLENHQGRRRHAEVALGSAGQQSLELADLFAERGLTRVLRWRPLTLIDRIELIAPAV